MPRVAVVDIGTNSTRLLIGDVQDGRMTSERVRQSTVTRLGQGVDATGRLDEQAMQRTYDTIAEYRHLIQRHHADRQLAILTSAVRDAANGHEFAQTVAERYELEPHILTGDDEARLTFLGATSERDSRDPTLVIDIGGGSTELVIGAGRDITFHVSTQAGVVRQSERHLRNDPPTAAEQEELARDVVKIIEQGVPREQRRTVQNAIAVAGTATSLAAIAQSLDPYDPERVHGYVIDREACRQILARLAAMPLADRREVRGLHPDRAPTIVAGVIILLEVLELFGIPRVEVSEHDILRGAALEFASGPA